MSLESKRSEDYLSPAAILKWQIMSTITLDDAYIHVYADFIDCIEMFGIKVKLSRK